MYNPGDLVRRLIPDTGYGCIGVVKQLYFQGTYGGIESSYAIVEITQGNSIYSIGAIASWYTAGIEIVDPVSNYYNFVSLTPDGDSIFEGYDGDI